MEGPGSWQNKLPRRPDMRIVILHGVGYRTGILRPRGPDEWTVGEPRPLHCAVPAGAWSCTRAADAHCPSDGS